MERCTSLQPQCWKKKEKEKGDYMKSRTDAKINTRNDEAAMAIEMLSNGSNSQ